MSDEKKEKWGSASTKSCTHANSSSYSMPFWSKSNIYEEQKAQKVEARGGSADARMPSCTRKCKCVCPFWSKSNIGGMESSKSGSKGIRKKEKQRGSNHAIWGMDSSKYRSKGSGSRKKGRQRRSTMSSKKIKKVVTPPSSVNPSVFSATEVTSNLRWQNHHMFTWEQYIQGTFSVEQKMEQRAHATSSRYTSSLNQVSRIDSPHDVQQDWSFLVDKIQYNQNGHKFLYSLLLKAVYYGTVLARSIFVLHKII